MCSNSFSADTPLSFYVCSLLYIHNDEQYIVMMNCHYLVEWTITYNIVLH